MKLDNVTVESDRRCRAEVLAEILKEVPFEVRGSRDLELTARMGLGRIIYLNVAKGELSGWTLGNDARIESKRDGARFTYDGKTYSLLVPRYCAA
ncbi:hypothetical protein J4447_02285 [Candidatus Pacearchaeota archaeon]|nr:hypothetical protein [Candidatus Pacearchaeota archaeon]